MSSILKLAPQANSQLHQREFRSDVAVGTCDRLRDKSQCREFGCCAGRFFPRRLLTFLLARFTDPSHGRNSGRRSSEPTG